MSMREYSRYQRHEQESTYHRRMRFFENNYKSDSSDEDTDETENYFQKSDNLQNSTGDKRIAFLNKQYLKTGIDLSDRSKISEKQKEEKEVLYGFSSNQRVPKQTVLDLCQSQPEKYILCKLDLNGVRNATCTPVNSSNGKKIKIKGRSNCGQAFNGDIVIVEADPLDEGEETQVGRVIGIKLRRRYLDIEHPVFVCTAAEMEGQLMIPLCKTVPKIHILNKRVTEHYPTQKNYKVELYEYDEVQGYLRFKEFLEIKPEEREKYVYVVAYLKWDIHHHYPLGAVIGCFETKSGTGRLRALEMQHRITSCYRQSTVTAVKSILSNPPKKQPDSETIKVYTIDHKNTQVFDDGLSIENISDGIASMYKVGIHITDVSRMIAKDSPIDEEARERCNTCYLGKDANAYHMLPEPLSTDLLSLRQGQPRHVISIYTKLDGNGRRSGDPFFSRSVIKPVENLSYEEVQEFIMKGEADTSEKSTTLCSLFDLATSMRKLRLKGAHYAFRNNPLVSSDQNKDIDVREAEYLVEEFMILANTMVATTLMDAFPSCIPLRCHAHPDDRTTSTWLKKRKGICEAIMSLQDKQIRFSHPHILTLDNLRSINVRMEIAVDIRIWKQVQEALEKKDYRRVQVFLGSDVLHPKQSVALREWLLFQNRARYCCSGTLDEENRKHFGLGLDLYVKCTSPLRSYSDLVAQRMLVAAMEKEACPHTEEEIEEICLDSNDASEEEKQYMEHYQTLVVADFLQSTNATKVSAIVSNLTERKLVLTVPYFGTSEEYTSLEFKLMGLCTQPKLEKLEEDDIVVAKWQKRIYDTHRIGFHSRKEHAHILYTIDPHRSSLFISSVDWAALLRASMKDMANASEKEQLQLVFDRIEEKRSASNNVSEDSVTEEEENDDKADDDDDEEEDNEDEGRENGDDLVYATDVCSEVNDKGMILNHLCQFQRQFQVGQTLTVQMGTANRNGYLVPSVQMVFVTETVAYCLPHMENPIACLSEYITSPASQSYRRERNYVNTWIPIMEMEAVTNIIRNEDSPLVKNVNVNFATDKPSSFTLSCAFCTERDLNFGYRKLTRDGCEEADTEEEELVSDPPFQDIKSCDFLCIRCTSDTDSCDLVCHAKTTQVRKKKLRKLPVYEICFALHPRSKIPKKGTYDCSLELLMKSRVDRRAEIVLKNLWKAPDLAKAIALRQTIPMLDRRQLDAFNRHPNTDITSPDVDIPNNNYNQKVAIEKALTSSFSLIQGPPGTGKTLIGIKLIYLFHQLNKLAASGDRRQILFCGPSNKSVDLVARLMHSIFANCKDAPQPIRLYSQSYECMDFPVPGRSGVSRRSLRDAQPDGYLTQEGLVLHHLIRKDDRPHAAEIHSYDVMFKTQKYKVTFADVQKYFETVSIATKEELNKYDVIFCTSAMAANPKLLQGTKGRIYQCIIDECGMCTEPETMVTIIATHADQVVLIGDHKQLQPIIQSRAASEMGLITSLFERYAETGTKHLTMLTQQYRMNPLICSFPSSQFYDDKLQTDKKHTSRWYVKHPLAMWGKTKPAKNIPIAFWHVEGQEETLEVTTEEGNERSKSNSMEVDKVVEVFTHMIETEHVSKDNIRIISQYNAQRHAIQERLKEVLEQKCDVLNKELTHIKTDSSYHGIRKQRMVSEIKKRLERVKEKYEGIKVNTVVACQGGESDYVIFSTVRSMPTRSIEPHASFGWLKIHLGFITDQHQINVALTRAKKGLVIIGNKHLLKCDENWRALLEFYEANDRVYSQFLPTRVKDISHKGGEA